MTNNMRPIHPGEILREEMEELNLSARQLATALHVPTNRVTGILNEQRAITGTRFDHGEKISKEVHPHAA